MIELLFRFGTDKILVRIDGADVTFGNTAFGAMMASIKGIRLDYVGVCREFPDLELHEDWHGEAIKRFMNKLKELKTEINREKYIIDELSKHGYVLEAKQKKGHRREVVK